jgi:adenylate kinase
MKSLSSVASSPSLNVLIFLGAPGAGKGTLAEKCVQELGFVQLSTGNLCRMHIAEKTGIGQQIDLITKSGRLVPDSLIVEMVADWFGKQAKKTSTIVLDGFPRTVPQAQALKRFFEEAFPAVRLSVVKLEISDETVVNRLCSRVVCENKVCQAVYSLISGSPLVPKRPSVCDVCEGALVVRADDTEESVRKRLQIYRQHESALLDFYVSSGQPIVKLLVEKPSQEVFEDFMRVICLDDR